MKQQSDGISRGIREGDGIQKGQALYWCLPPLSKGTMDFGKICV